MVCVLVRLERDEPGVCVLVRLVKAEPVFMQEQTLYLQHQLLYWITC